MNNNAKLWVEALRSGEYEQGSGWLQQQFIGDGYCCLGVACKVYENQTGIELIRRGGILKGCNLANEYSQVKQWLGLNTPAGKFGNTALTNLNDEGKTFAEIADVIESEPEGLFV